MTWTACNTYNALGQRVRDVNNGYTTDEAYGADGTLLWRNTGGDSNTRAFVPFQGRILAEYYWGSTPGTLFDHPDEIGSATASTAYNGSSCQDRLYYPFGEFWTGAGSCGMHQEFAQLPDYDAETDQYNTLNRHYSPSGRWMSPDPAGQDAADPSDPQAWNLYAYARNNPTTLTDPDGEDADCHYSPDGVLHCTTYAPLPEEDFPKVVLAAGSIALGGSELGPIDLLVAGTFLAVRCYQTHCTTNLFSKGNNTPPSSPASSSSVSNTASPNPDPNRQQSRQKEKQEDTN